MTVLFSSSHLPVAVKRNINFILQERSYFDGYRRDDLIEYDEELFPYLYVNNDYRSWDGAQHPTFAGSNVRRTPSRKQLQGVPCYTGLRVGDLINEKGCKVDPDKEPLKIDSIIGISLSDEWSHGDIVYLASYATVKDTILEDITHKDVYQKVVEHLTDKVWLDVVHASPVARI